ncbi:hypothetical protein YC2023_028055 [Brassica napus]
MVNLPDSLYEDYTISRVNLPSALASTVPPSPDIRMIIKWVNDLHNNIPSTFDFALQNLTITTKSLVKDCHYFQRGEILISNKIMSVAYPFNCMIIRI